MEADEAYNKLIEGEITFDDLAKLDKKYPGIADRVIKRLVDDPYPFLKKGE